MTKNLLFNKGSLPPKSVMIREAYQRLEDIASQTQKRMTSKGYISATKRIMMNYVGKRYKNKITSKEMGLLENKLKVYNLTLNNLNSNEKRDIDVAITLNNSNTIIQNDFLKENNNNLDEFYSLSNQEQNIIFSNFLKNKINFLRDYISKNKLTSAKIDKLTRLNGVLITKKVTQYNEEETLESSIVYKNIIKEFDSVYSKLETQKQQIINLMDELKRVERLPEEINKTKQIYEINSKLRNENKKLRNLQLLFNKINDKKVNYEKTFAEKQVSEARKENKNFGVSSSYHVLDYYNFPKKSSDGKNVSNISPDTQDGKMIEIYIRRFMSTFRAQLDKFYRAFENSNEKLKQKFYNSSRSLTTDFGLNFTALKNLQKTLNKEIDKISENYEVSKDELLKKISNDELELNKDEQKIFDCANELSKTEKNLINELSKLGVDVNKVSLKK